jgi:2-polyprenyl-6-methoxyphenol hydroxylase-like FAD-dependent oxidoreductase
MRDAGRVIAGGAIEDHRGREIQRFDEALTRSFPDPQVAIHRADLVRVLADAARGVELRAGARCVGFEERGSRVAVELQSGETLEADALVGADGIWSAVRAQLLGDAPPRYAGYTCWRGVVEASAAPWPSDRVVERWGPGSRFGIVPLGADRIYWFATTNAPAGGEDPPGGRRESVAAVFSDWASPVPELIASTEERAIMRNDILDRAPVKRWGEGRVTLLGDAAHPMTPNMGQGGCQAIEDAVVLGQELAREADLARALRAYEARRHARTSWFVTQSWSSGRVAQWSSGLARGLRDGAMRLFGRALMRGAMKRAWTFA